MKGNIKYVENLEIASKLGYRDRILIAKNTGYSRYTIYAILQGKRRMNDKVKKAIFDMLNSRKELDNELNNI